MAQQTITEQGAFSADIATKVNANFTECYGAALLHQGSRTLTNSEIMHLPSTAITLVGAPGANRLIVPSRCVVVLDTTAGAYSCDAGSSWLLAYAGDFYASGIKGVAGLLQGTGIKTTQIPADAYQIDADNFGASVVISDSANASVSDVTNAALQIRDDWNGVSDYTDGASANTLVVALTFLVFDTSTHAFLSQAASGWNQTTRTFA